MARDLTVTVLNLLLALLLLGDLGMIVASSKGSAPPSELKAVGEKKILNQTTRTSPLFPIVPVRHGSQQMPISQGLTPNPGARRTGT